MSGEHLKGPVWLMQPIPYLGGELEGEWNWEPKIDGWRIQFIRYSDEKAECWGRRLERRPNWTEKLTAITSIAQEILPPSTLVDAELTSDRGRRFIPSLFARESKAKPLIYLFDILFYKGVYLAGLPLKERRSYLKRLRLKEPFSLLPTFPLTSLEEALREALSKGHEGIVELSFMLLLREVLSILVR